MSNFQQFSRLDPVDGSVFGGPQPLLRRDLRQDEVCQSLFRRSEMLRPVLRLADSHQELLGLQQPNSQPLCGEFHFCRLSKPLREPSKPHWHVHQGLALVKFRLFGHFGALAQVTAIGPQTRSLTALTSLDYQEGRDHRGESLLVTCRALDPRYGFLSTLVLFRCRKL